jgi:predicted permease
MGRCTTFLSVVVLGISMASMQLKTIFSDVKMYLFAGIRFLGVPVVVTLLLKPWIANEILLGVITLTLALPVANMPLMMAQQNAEDTSTLSRGIVLTTLLSLVTITLVSGVL